MLLGVRVCGREGTGGRSGVMGRRRHATDLDLELVADDGKVLGEEVVGTLAAGRAQARREQGEGGRGRNVVSGGSHAGPGSWAYKSLKLGGVAWVDMVL
jgi:hypothetical protein